VPNYESATFSKDLLGSKQVIGLLTKKVYTTAKASYTTTKKAYTTTKAPYTIATSYFPSIDFICFINLLFLLKNGFNF
jgi:hypothetical protein